MIYNAYKNQHKTNILKHTNTYTYVIAKGGKAHWLSFQLYNWVKGKD